MSSFWSGFIIIATLGGILGLAWLVTANARGKVGDPGNPQSTGHVWDEDLEELNNPLPRWWLNLFYLTMVFGVVYLLLYPGLGSFKMFLGWTQLEQYRGEMAKAESRYGPLFEKYRNTEIETLAGDAKAVQVGERLFAAYCTTCHGSDAAGVRGFPNLTDDDWLWGGQPSAIEQSILEGRTGVMPPWGSVLGEQGVHNVTEYVLSLSARAKDEKAASEGAVVYQQFCVACHMPDGKGNPALGAPNLTDDIWLHGASPKTIASIIAQGQQGRMPAHREFLGEAKVHLLAAYVYSLSRRK